MVTNGYSTRPALNTEHEHTNGFISTVAGAGKAIQSEIVRNQIVRDVYELILDLLLYFASLLCFGGWMNIMNG